MHPHAHAQLSEQHVCLQPLSGGWTVGQLFPGTVANKSVLGRTIDVLPLRLVRTVYPLFACCNVTPGDKPGDFLISKQQFKRLRLPKVDCTISRQQAVLQPPTPTS